MITTAALFDLSHTVMGDFLKEYRYAWEAIPRIGAAASALGATLSREQFQERSPGVWVAKTAVVAENACLIAPCIIDEDATVRHGAFLRGAVVVGKGAVVGNSTELKNTVLLDGAQLPHFNYAGDSILGYRAHLGAGAVISNLKCDRSPIFLQWEGERVASNLKKLGALVGDGAEVGCHCVLNPGTVLGKHCTVYPLSSVRGSVGEGMICKGGGEVCPRQ